MRETTRIAGGLALLLLAGAAPAGCDGGRPAAGLPRPVAEAIAIARSGDAEERAQAAFRRHGCGTCHVIPGVAGANGQVGPPLTAMARQVYVGGVLPNLPENLEAWIRDPVAIDPRTAMPDLAVTDGEARAIAGYLYSVGGS
ncbi:c-type cytochrome [Azospirillum sp. ST 5-10]|uniref:c-type cytochrome n=1 Tax=unclassified Azospirillum TaxID=2630922 RepID=UPI003F49CDCB